MMSNQLVYWIRACSLRSRPGFPAIIWRGIRPPHTYGALCQVEKVGLFFLAKQGELDNQLLYARRGNDRLRSIGSFIFSDGTVKGM